MINRRFPSADEPLNYEHVLYNHLECMSFFVAQGIADLKQMIVIYEQLVTPMMDNREREVLAVFKLVMQDIRSLVMEYYDEVKQKIQESSEKPEQDLDRLRQERDEVLEELEDIYYKFLLKLLVSFTKYVIERGQDEYKAYELWRDLKIELRSVLPFSEEIVDELVKMYDSNSRCDSSTGSEREESMAVE